MPRMLRSWRRLRVAFCAAVLLLPVAAVRLAAPDCAAACSCAVPAPTIASLKDEPGIAVFKGAVVESQLGENGQYRIVIEVSRAFKGSFPQARVLALGSNNGGDCSVSLAVGRTLVMVTEQHGVTITPIACLPFADIGTGDGERLVADAIAVFGEGTVPPGATTPAPIAKPTISPLPLLYGLGVVLVAATAMEIGARIRRNSR